MLQPHERRLVLASSSPRRKQLMGLLGLPYDVVVKPVDEQIAPGVKSGGSCAGTCAT